MDFSHEGNPRCVHLLLGRSRAVVDLDRFAQRRVKALLNAFDRAQVLLAALESVCLVNHLFEDGFVRFHSVYDLDRDAIHHRQTVGEARHHIGGACKLREKRRGVGVGANEFCDVGDKAVFILKAPTDVVVREVGVRNLCHELDQLIGRGDHLGGVYRVQLN